MSMMKTPINFESFFSCMKDVACITDVKGCVIKVNHEWEKNVESTDVPFVLFEKLHTRDVSIWRMNWESIASGDVDSIQLPGRVKSSLAEDKYFYAQWSVFRVGDCFFITGKEVDRESVRQDRFDHVFDNDISQISTFLEYTSDAVYWSNEYGYFDYVNSKACEMLGYTKDEMKGLSIFDIDPFFEISYSAMDMHIHIQNRHNYSQVFETRHRKKSGELFPVEVNSIFIWQHNKGYVLCFVRDISERKEREKELQRSQKLLKESQRIAKIGNFELKLDSNIVTWSDEIYDLFGFAKSEAELKFEDVLLFMPKIDKINVKKAINRSIKEKRFIDHEHSGIKKNGEIIHLHITGAVGLNKEGCVERICGVVQDVTEQKIQRQQLVYAKNKAEESDRLKSAFLANLSHEIRTPMNAIVGFSSFLKDQENTKEEIQKYSEIIINSGEHLLALINDIIDISKIDVGEVHIVKTNVKITSLLKEVFTFFHSYLETKNKKNIKIYLDMPDEEDIYVYTDEMRLKQILYNIIGNAIKFTEKGYVKIIFRKEGDFLRFNIKDTGVGISSDKKDVIFERFQQGERSTEKIYGGTGLGLAIVKACVELLGGKISFTSIQGKGTNFQFVLNI